LEAFIPR